ncbi:MAG: hypothetical protein L0I76_25745 [Pseudonocardia sp.]|nr:hypothetical protein [Pseudonocardia sp.]
MNHAQSELIRLHHAELRQAADHHRLVTAVRETARSRRPLVATLLDWLTQPAPRRQRGVPEAEPCPS